MNRKDFVMEYQEAGFAMIGLIVLISVGGMCAKECCFRNANAQSMTPLFDTVLTFLLILWPYVCYWVIAKFWEGVYLNSDLTAG